MKQILAAILLLPATLFGGRVSCDDMCGYGTAEVGAGLIALRPSTSPLDYAIRDPGGVTTASLPQGRSRGFHPELELGLRAAIGYGSRRGCADAKVEYTFLHSRDINLTTTDSALWPVLIHPSPFSPLQNGPVAAESRLRSKFDYDGVDLQLATRFNVGRCLTFRSYGGLHFVNLDHKLAEDIQGFIPGQNLQILQFWCDRRCSWGIGPLIGSDFNWRFRRYLAITGHFDIALVAGVTRWRRLEETAVAHLPFEEILDVTRSHLHHVTPYIRGSLGVAYCLCVPWAYRLTIEVTYETCSYIDGMGLFRFDDERATGSSQRLNFNLDGPVLMVSIVI